MQRYSVPQCQHYFSVVFGSKALYLEKEFEAWIVEESQCLAPEGRSEI